MTQTSNVGGMSVALQTADAVTPNRPAGPADVTSTPPDRVEAWPRETSCGGAVQHSSVSFASLKPSPLKPSHANESASPRRRNRGVMQTGLRVRPAAWFGRCLPSPSPGYDLLSRVRNRLSCRPDISYLEYCLHMSNVNQRWRVSAATIGKEVATNGPPGGPEPRMGIQSTNSRPSTVSLTTISPRGHILRTSCR